MIKEFDLYQNETRRTAPVIDETIECLVNFSMGLSGESSEIIKALVDTVSVPSNKINLVKTTTLKEMGDCCWYIARTADALGYKLSEVTGTNDIDKMDRVVHQIVHSDKIIFSDGSDDKLLEHYAMRLSASAGNITDNLKKVVFHGHELNPELIVKNLERMIIVISKTSYLLGCGTSEVLDMNIEKLKKRYPNGFSSEDSINRKE